MLPHEDPAAPERRPSAAPHGAHRDKDTEEWVVTIDTSTGTARRIERLGLDGSRTELSHSEDAATVDAAPVNPFGLVGSSRGLFATAAALRGYSGKDIEDWVVTIEMTTGTALRIERLGRDGRRTEFSQDEYATLMAMANPVDPFGLLGSGSGSPATAGVRNLAMSQALSAIPYLTAYWQGYADAMASDAATTDFWLSP